MRRGSILFLVCLGVLSGCRDTGQPVAVGTLERHRIELRAERQESILQLDVSEGDVVETGDLIAVLDNRRTLALLGQSRADRDLAAARLAELVRGFRYEEIDQARARLAEAEASLVQLQPRLRRAQRLVVDGVEPQSTLDQAEADHAAAEARRDAARSSLEQYLNGATVEEHDQAGAELVRAEQAIKKLEIDVQRLNVKAPRKGTIEALPFKVGDEPVVGSTIAVLLVGEGPFARVYVPAELRAGAVQGGKVSVVVDGYPNPFEGRIRTIAAEAAFTPYYALTEKDRGHFVYLAEIDLLGESVGDLPTGLPVEVVF